MLNNKDFSNLLTWRYIFYINCTILNIILVLEPNYLQWAEKILNKIYKMLFKIKMKYNHFKIKWLSNIYEMSKNWFPVVCLSS